MTITMLLGNTLRAAEFCMVPGGRMNETMIA